jgi:hypothetical protein
MQETPIFQALNESVRIAPGRARAAQKVYRGDRDLGRIAEGDWLCKRATNARRRNPPRSYEFKKSPGIKGFLVQLIAGKDGGDGGIRTLDRALQPYNGLANRRLQPLGHVSNMADMPDAGATRKRQIRLGRTS